MIRKIALSFAIAVLLVLGAVASTFWPRATHIDRHPDYEIIYDREIRLLPIGGWGLSSDLWVDHGPAYQRNHYVTKLGFVVVEDVIAYRYFK